MRTHLVASSSGSVLPVTPLLSIGAQGSIGGVIYGPYLSGTLWPTLCLYQAAVHGPFPGRGCLIGLGLWLSVKDGIHLHLFLYLFQTDRTPE